MTLHPLGVLAEFNFMEVKATHMWHIALMLFVYIITDSPPPGK